MSTAFINGDYMPLSEARISPMDRGFLFGDGIYEVIPCYAGRLVGFAPHMARMAQGLAALDIALNWSTEEWHELCQELSQRNGSGNLGLYLQVSRGADTKRFHAYPQDVTPTIFGFAFEIPEEPLPDRNRAKTYRVATSQDLRWQRCQIKSTALLGNVMHFQQGHAAGLDETLLYNARGELTEGSAVNVFMVKNGEISTPPLDNQILPGITRHILLQVLRKDGALPVSERVITMEELREADEVWITSSTKEIAPVVEIDGRRVGDGRVGSVWEEAQARFSRHKYEY